MGFFPIRLTLPTWTVGEMSEWFKEHAWKACVQETVPRVRIPLSPPFDALRTAFFTCSWQAISENRILWTIRYQASNALSQSMDIARSNSPLRKRSLYIGQTNNVAKRLERHKHGSGARHNLQLKQCNLVIVEGPFGTRRVRR